MKYSSCVLAVAFAIAAGSAFSETLTVGRGEKYEKPSQAAKAAKDGDTIIIKKGVYVDCASWNASNLTIKGAEGAAKTIIRYSDSMKRIAAGKALWVVGGSNCTVEGVTFEGAKCPDNNAAGLWIGAASGTTKVVDCVFKKNQNGILSSAQPEAEIAIVGCTFRENGNGDGYSHNIYIGKVKKLTCSKITSDHCNLGHCLKSRALETVIEESVFDDGDDGISSYLVNCPNGGKVRMSSCKLVQSATASNGVMVSIGEEGAYPGTEFDDDMNEFENRRHGGTEVVLKK